jgi:peptidoglycan hydrolase-like protein with peptidoglycan-binding domain
MNNTINALKALRGTTLVLAAVFATIVIGLVYTPLQAHAALLTQQVQIGDTNSSVTSLQTFLSTFNDVYPSGLVTGYFGPLTEQGVIGFQNASGISAVGRVGPITLAAINADMLNGSGTVTSDANLDSPIMSGITVSSSANSATFTWTTNKPATDSVMYGSTSTFVYATSQSVIANGPGTSTTITVTGLQPNTTYYYVLQSVDAYGNITWTTSQPVKTD